MWLRIGLKVLIAVAIAQAAPQDAIPIYPITNSTQPAPGSTGACEAKCSVYYPQISAISWVPESQISYTTKMTVGTVSEIIYTESKSILYTETKTVWGAVPSEYDLYHQYTNEAGTVVVDVALTVSDKVLFSRLTYPTPYLDYSSKYHWKGILPMQGKAYSFLCATATPEPAHVPLPQHPQYPQPTGAKADGEDPWGQEHQPIWVTLDVEPEKAFFDAAFPFESAFSHCESVAQITPAPTIFSIPKFVLDHTTVYRKPLSDPIIHTESTATGWEETFPPLLPTNGPDMTPWIPHDEISESGFEVTSLPQPQTTRSNSLGRPTSMAIHWEITASGFEQVPQGEPTRQPDQPPTLGEIIVDLINNHPEYFTRPSANPGSESAPTDAFAAHEPVFTYIATTVNGQSTANPAYILPGSSATATIGQTVTINGQTTVLTVPNAVFTSVSTTLNGVITAVPVYIISGSMTATIGQTVTIGGTTVVLPTPTNTEGLNQRPAGDAKVTSEARPRATGGSDDFRGDAVHGLEIIWSTSLVGIIALVVVWL